MADEKKPEKEKKKPKDEETSLGDILEEFIDADKELDEIDAATDSDQVDYRRAIKYGSSMLTPVKPEGAKNGQGTDAILQEEKPDYTTNSIGKSERGRTSTRKTHPVEIGDETASMLEQIPFKYNKAARALDDENRGTILPLLKKVEDYLARREYKDAVLGIGEVETSYIGDIPENVREFIEHVKKYVERLDRV